MEEARRDPGKHLRLEGPRELRERARNAARDARDDPMRSRFESFMLYAEVRLKHALSVARSDRRSKRNIPLTATCCEILMRLGRAFPQCSSLRTGHQGGSERHILDFDENMFAEAERWSQATRR